MDDGEARDRRPRSREPEQARPEAEDAGRRSPYYPPRGEPLRAPWDPLEPTEGRPRSAQRDRPRVRRPGPIRRFVAEWGWRAYALPLVLVLTVVVIADAVTKQHDPGTTAAAPRPTTAAKPAPPSPGVPAGPIGALPDGPPYAVQGDGTYRVVPGSYPATGKPGAQLYTYTIEIENGVDVSAQGGDEAVGHLIDSILLDPRSWTADGKVAFQRVDSGEPDFQISLSSAMTIRQFCGYDIPLETSCYNPSTGRVYLNDARWVRGAIPFGNDLATYREYQVNHEVGHAVGHPLHQPCPAEGAPAPIMMQQTFGVQNSQIFTLDPAGVVPDDNRTCKVNPWPFPDAPLGTYPPTPGAMTPGAPTSAATTAEAPTDASATESSANG